MPTPARPCPHLPAATGGSFSVAAGRLSFTYGFKGPAVSIDTACSSALVATHQGVLQLRGRPQHAVLTAGVNLMLSEATSAAAQAAGMLTLDGRCKTLDADADGYVRAEACTAFLLTAASAGDIPAAVYLAATFVNQDGRSSSLTAPNGPSQQAVIRGALGAASLQPRDVGALEMHGTGTPLGDPIEIGAAFAVLRRSDAPLRLTAAKSRIGHSEPVSGTVGLAHATAQLAHASTSAVMHLRSFNPMLSGLIQTHTAGGWAAPYVARQDGTGLAGSAHGTPWRMASGISAFAFQGTNAHAVVVAADGLPASRQPVEDTWQGRRFWFAAPPHVLVARLVAARPMAQFQAALSGAALSYLWDHRVQGRPLFPGAAMFEAAFSAGALLLAGSSATTAGAGAAPLALAGASIPAPLVLPEMSGSSTGTMLTTAVEPATGRVVVHSKDAAGRAATHLAGMLAYTATVTSTATSLEQPSAALAWLASAAQSAAPQLPAGAIADVQQCVRSQAGQHHMHPAVIDNATQASRPRGSSETVLLLPGRCACATMP